MKWKVEGQLHLAGAVRALDGGFDEDARTPKEEELHKCTRLSENEHGDNVEAFPIHVGAIHLEKNLLATSQRTLSWHTPTEKNLLATSQRTLSWHTPTPRVHVPPNSPAHARSGHRRLQVLASRSVQLESLE